MDSEKKTSAEWQKIYSNIEILSPDGWDKNNLKYSWDEEKITVTEYFSRRSKSKQYFKIKPKRKQ